MKPRTIQVKAAAGRKVFFPRAVKSSPGARVFILQGEEVAEVPEGDAFVQKRLHAGDLVRVKAKARKAPPAPKTEKEAE